MRDSFDSSIAESLSSTLDKLWSRTFRVWFYLPVFALQPRSDFFSSGIHNLPASCPSGPQTERHIHTQKQLHSFVLTLETFHQLDKLPSLKSPKQVWDTSPDCFNNRGVFFLDPISPPPACLPMLSQHQRPHRPPLRVRLCTESSPQCVPEFAVR